MRRPTHEQTVLSKIKTRGQPTNTKSSIAMLEAKLTSMTRAAESGTTPPVHHSLPAKPPPSAPYLAASSKASILSQKPSTATSIGSPGSAPTRSTLLGGTPRTPTPSQGAGIFSSSTSTQSRSGSTTPMGQQTPPSSSFTGALTPASGSQRRPKPASVLRGVKIGKSKG